MSTDVSIDRDLAVGRNTTIGGTVDVSGNATFEHDIEIKGWLKSYNIRSQNNKGMFATLAQLQTAYPSPEAGWFAGIPSTDSEGDTVYNLYTVVNGAWANSGYEYYSDKGDKGDTGDAGADGEDGEDGEDGTIVTVTPTSFSTLIGTTEKGIKICAITVDGVEKEIKTNSMYLTQAQYNSIVAAGTVDSHVEYNIIED